MARMEVVIEDVEVEREVFVTRPDHVGMFVDPVGMAFQRVAVAGDVDGLAVLPIRVEGESETPGSNWPARGIKPGVAHNVPKSGGWRLMRIARQVETEHPLGRRVRARRRTQGDEHLRPQNRTKKAPLAQVAAHLKGGFLHMALEDLLIGRQKRGRDRSRARVLARNGELRLHYRGGVALALHQRLADEVERDFAVRVSHERADVNVGFGALGGARELERHFVHAFKTVFLEGARRPLFDFGNARRGRKSVTVVAAVERHAHLDFAATMAVQTVAVLDAVFVQMTVMRQFAFFIFNEHHHVVADMDALRCEGRQHILEARV